MTEKRPTNARVPSRLSWILYRASLYGHIHVRSRLEHVLDLDRQFADADAGRVTDRVRDCRGRYELAVKLGIDPDRATAINDTMTEPVEGKPFSSRSHRPRRPHRSKNLAPAILLLGAKSARLSTRLRLTLVERDRMRTTDPCTEFTCE